MRLRLIVIAAAACALVAAGGAVAASGPSHLDLPDGWQPEGIATGPGHNVFVGSIPTGAVLRLNTKTGATQTVVPARDGHAATGLKARNHRLFVSGGPTGKAFVYDTRSGDELASFQLAPDSTTFVNDVALANHTAYFTDSQRAVIYAVERDLSGFREIALNGFTLQSGFNLNGIVAAGKYLIAVQSNTGALWRIDPKTGDATQISAPEVKNGDGLLLVGKTLYVVQNIDNKISVLRLAGKFTSATLERTITSPDLDVPTTIARHGNRLFAVNARFTTTDPQPAPYWVTALRR